MTNDDVLKFSSHDLSIFCYGGVSDVYVEYAHTGHDFFVGLVAPDKAPEDEARFPNSTSGSYVTFAGPVIVRWTARDGSKLDASIDLDPIFPDRAVLHSQDPGRIYQPAPIVGKSPTILVEVNDRCVSISENGKAVRGAAPVRLARSVVPGVRRPVRRHGQRRHQRP